MQPVIQTDPGLPQGFDAGVVGQSQVLMAVSALVHIPRLSTTTT